MDTRPDVDVADFAEAAFHESNDAIFVVDPTDLRILHANSTALRLTELKRKFLLESTIDRIVIGVDTERISQLSTACRQTEFFHSEDRYTLKRGFGADLSVNVSVTRVHSQPTPVAMLVVRDITQSKLAEQSLRAVNERLSHANAQLAKAQSEIRDQERLRAFQELAGGVVHDLNNALFPITTLTQLLLDRDGIDAEAREHLSLVSQAARDAARIVEDLGVFNLTERHVRWEQVDLRLLVQQVADSFHVGHHGDAPISILLELVDDAVVRGNASDLRRVFSNLIRNSVAAMSSGGVITIRLKRESDQVVVEVHDTGGGMDQEELSHCFESFYTTRAGGTGLGLAICHRLVQVHAGTINASSRLGNGTVISVSLPVDLGKPEVLAARPKKQDTDFSALSVLYIDDDSSVRESVKAMLASMQIRVSMAASGRSGMDLLANDEFDLVITDYMMPEMDGSEVVRRVRKLRPGMPVAVVSGRLDHEVREMMGHAQQPDFYVNKLDLAEQLAKIFAEIRTKRLAA